MTDIDPYLPSVKKPILYGFDEYQTYDLIINFNPPQRVFNIGHLWADLLIIDGNNEMSQPLWWIIFLIERFTPLPIPSNLIENYAKKISKFRSIYNWFCFQEAPTNGADFYGRLSVYQNFINTKLVASRETFPVSNTIIDFPFNYQTPAFVIDLSSYDFTYCNLFYAKCNPDEQDNKSVTAEQKRGQAFIINWATFPIKKSADGFLNLSDCVAFSLVIESDNAKVITYLESVINDYLLYKNIDSGLKKIKDLLESNYPNYHNYWDMENQVWIPIPPELYAETFIAANNNFWKHPNITILNDKNLDDIWVFKNENTYETDLGDLLIFYQKSYYDLFTTYQEDGTIMTGILSDEELIEEADKRYYLDDYTNLWSKFIMPDTPRIKEIHAALNASAFAAIDGVNVVANLGYYIERIARVNGISVNPDGSIRSIRNSARLEQDEVIPAGYNFGQFGEHFAGITDKKLGQLGGKDTEKRDGIVYEVKSNMIEKDAKGNTTIKAGGYILCENIPQYIHVLMQDLDKALSLQEMGAFPLPTPNNKDYVIYEGIHGLIADIAYMLSRLSDNIIQSHVLGLKNNALLMETLRATGVAITEKRIDVQIDDKNTQIVNPAVAENSLTITDFLFQILQNLSLIVGSQITLKMENKEGI